MMDTERPAFERWRARIGMVAYGAVVLGLCFGIGLYVLQQRALAITVLAWTCGLLMALPVAQLVAVLVDEVRGRDWGFAALACCVLVLIGYAVICHL